MSTEAEGLLSDLASAGWTDVQIQQNERRVIGEGVSPDGHFRGHHIVHANHPERATAALLAEMRRWL